MAVPVALAALPAILGIGAQALGSEEERKASLKGAKTQAEIERLSRESEKRQFEKQIARQKPFLEVGEIALPRFIEAISNRGDISGLPATQIQGDLIAEFLGEEAPQFIKERALTNLSAVEAERNKGRLADLISAGLGGALSATGSRADLGTAAGRSLAREASTTGEALQRSAMARQNILGQAVTGLAGLPALIAAGRGPTGVIPTTPQGLPLGGGEQFRGFA